MKTLRRIFMIGLDAFDTFLADDGWAIASHIALSTLMALFPFLIVLTSLAGFFGLWFDRIVPQLGRILRTRRRN